MVELAATPALIGRDTELSAAERLRVEKARDRARKELAQQAIERRGRLNLIEGSLSPSGSLQIRLKGMTEIAKRYERGCAEGQGEQWPATTGNCLKLAISGITLEIKSLQVEAESLRRELGITN